MGAFEIPMYMREGALHLSEALAAEFFCFPTWISVEHLKSTELLLRLSLTPR